MDCRKCALCSSAFCFCSIVNRVIIVGITADDTHFAILQQIDLAPQIVLHGGMLVVGDMIGSDVQENAVVKGLIINTIHIVSLTGDLGSNSREAVLAS